MFTHTHATAHIHANTKTQHANTPHTRHTLVWGRWGHRPGATVFVVSPQQVQWATVMCAAAAAAAAASPPTTAAVSRHLHATAASPPGTVAACGPGTALCLHRPHTPPVTAHTTATATATARTTAPQDAWGRERTIALAGVHDHTLSEGNRDIRIMTTGAHTYMYTYACASMGGGAGGVLQRELEDTQ